MNKKYRKIYSILLATILCFTLSNPLSTHAKENAATPYAYDTVSKSYTRTFGKTLTCQSISPSYVTSDMLNSSQKSVTFNIQLTGTEYYGAAEPPVRCGESHLSGLTEPPHFVY